MQTLCGYGDMWRDSMSTTQTEFLQTHAPDGVLTPQQAAQFLELAEGDTSTALEPGGKPVATPAAADTPTPVPGEPNDAAQPPASDPDPATAVILAKDGKHTIPYEKLTEARAAEQSWKARAEAAQLELDALKAQARQRADAGQAPTQTDTAVAAATVAIENGVDPAIFGDFSEEELAKGIQKMVVQVVEQATAKLRGELSSVVAPLQQKQAQTAQEAHYGAIYARHPDADSMAESKELADWIHAQPSFARAGYQAVLEQGSAAEVIELFDSFKGAAGKTTLPATPALDVAAAAKAAIAKAAQAVPSSLTDFPGGRAGPANKFEALENMQPHELAEAFQTMSQDQREAYLNRNM